MKKPDGANYLKSLGENEIMPGRQIIHISVAATNKEKKEIEFGIEIDDEFIGLLKTTIPVEAQVEIAQKLAWIVENAFLKQLGLEPQ